MDASRSNVARQREITARARRDHPDFDRDHAAIELAVRDCAIAYLWNPIVSAHEFEYRGWSTTLYAGIEQSTRTAFVTFRGTDQAIDWVVNLLFVPAPLKHPTAHAGFVWAWRIAKRRLLPWLCARRAQFDRVRVAGHSLGGALALACTYDLLAEGFDVDRCITVGAPRLYTAGSLHRVASTIGDRLMRVVKQDDVVPKVPPEFLGFRHLGKEWVYVGESLGQREPEPVPKLSRALERAWYYVNGGAAGPWMRKYLGPNSETHLILYATAILGSLGGVFALLAQVLGYSLAVLLLATLGMLVVTGGLIAIAAHRSGRYAATRKAANMLEEWQLHHLREIAKGQPLEPTGDGHVNVEFAIQIKSHHSAARKRRLLRNFRRFFGKDAFCTALGRSIDESAAREIGANGSRPLPGDPLELQLTRVCVALQLYGYSSAEIDRMLEDGVMRRPRDWSRYYAPSAT
jgi:hypothetical protein